MAMPKSKNRRLVVARGPDRPMLELAADVLEHPGGWLTAPSAQLGGRKPGDLIGTAEEEKVRHLLNAVDQGFF